MNSFVARERARQIAMRAAGMFPFAGEEHGVVRGRTYPFVLPKEHWTENLDPAIRERAIGYFKRWRITWHIMAHHLLSSQVCCINHLMPFATEPVALARLLEPVFGPGLEMLPITDDGLHGEDWFVGFEYAGPPGADHLGEGKGKPLTRGANCTSCDAVVRFRRDGRIETVLIEWKYTEAYGDHGPRSGDAERERRYRHLIERADGPLAPDIEVPFDRFLVDPFYQFMRQQLLAQQMERARELSSDVVRVLHIAPRSNHVFASVPVRAFRPFGTSATGAWRNILSQPDRFVSRYVEDIFGPAIHSDAGLLLSYSRKRYAFSSDLVA